MRGKNYSTMNNCSHDIADYQNKFWKSRELSEALKKLCQKKYERGEVLPDIGRKRKRKALITKEDPEVISMED